MHFISAVHLHLALWLISILSVKHVRGLLQFRSSTSSMNSRIQSNGIEDREFNSNRGIHHLFFTVNEEKRMFKMKRIESAESSSLLFKEILHRYRNYTIIYSVFNLWNGESSVPVLITDAVILPSMTIYGKVLCHQPATSTFNEGFSNSSRRSFINTGFLYYCPCHMFKSPAGGL
ncbi:hypothetical protein T4D_837 [Trichinella pseudospiralis]|uniref:Uncharacterized protein n=1 Tax=Trichinella pseudospiralis TaxID=6337 RepID=A0A0V1FUK7_TRIPS|nr:hypothetical protein T4D_837 [Trichinella pseudospiralis]